MFGANERRPSIGPSVRAAFVDGLAFRFPGTEAVPVRGLLMVVAYLIAMALVVPTVRVWPASTVVFPFVSGLVWRSWQAWRVQRRVGRSGRYGLAASLGAATTVLGVFGLFAVFSWSLGPLMEASLAYRLVMAFDDPGTGQLVTGIAIALLILGTVAYLWRGWAARNGKHT